MSSSNYHHLIQPLKDALKDDYYFITTIINKSTQSQNTYILAPDEYNALENFKQYYELEIDNNINKTKHPYILLLTSYTFSSQNKKIYAVFNMTQVMRQNGITVDIDENSKKVMCTVFLSQKNYTATIAKMNSYFKKYSDKAAGGSQRTSQKAAVKKPSTSQSQSVPMTRSRTRQRQTSQADISSSSSSSRAGEMQASGAGGSRSSSGIRTDTSQASGAGGSRSSSGIRADTSQASRGSSSGRSADSSSIFSTVGNVAAVVGTGLSSVARGLSTVARGKSSVSPPQPQSAPVTSDVSLSGSGSQPQSAASRSHFPSDPSGSQGAAFMSDFPAPGSGSQTSTIIHDSPPAVIDPQTQIAPSRSHFSPDPNASQPILSVSHSDSSAIRDVQPKLKRYTDKTVHTSSVPADRSRSVSTTYSPIRQKTSSKGSTSSSKSSLPLGTVTDRHASTHTNQGRSRRMSGRSNPQSDRSNAPKRQPTITEYFPNSVPIIQLNLIFVHFFEDGVFTEYTILFDKARRSLQKSAISNQDQVVNTFFPGANVDSDKYIYKQYENNNVTITIDKEDVFKEFEHAHMSNKGRYFIKIKSDQLHTLHKLVQLF